MIDLVIWVVMEESKVAIIDLDSVVFTIGNPNKVLDSAGNPMRTEDGSKFLYIDKTDDELIQSTDDIMKMILARGNFTHYIGFIKGKNTIKRKKLINPDYKSNRKGDKPAWMDLVVSTLLKNWNVAIVDEIEVDDAVNITRLFIPNSNIVAIDSDLLGLEGTHFNWRKDEWVTRTREEAKKQFWKDMICGTHNNTKGLKGKGEKYVEGLFKINPEDIRIGKYLEFTFNEYISHYGEELGIENFYKEYKMLKILDKPAYGFNPADYQLDTFKI